MEGFTLAMALVDALPVGFFAAGVFLISARFDSKLFLAGAVLCVLAGAFKVAWKLILGTAKKNVKLLNKLFLPLQISGFLIIVISVIVNLKNISLAAVIGALTGLPTVIFAVLWLAAMGTMIVFSRRFDNSARANWKAQIINTAAQFFFFMTMLFI